jgi:hypothetical protein
MYTAGIARLIDIATWLGWIEGRGELSHRSVGAGLLSPDTQRFHTGASIAGCRHEVAPWPEVSVDRAVHREKVLGLANGLEPLHLSLSSSRRPMRVLSTVVEIAARAVFDPARRARRATP